MKIIFIIFLAFMQFNSFAETITTLDGRVFRDAKIDKRDAAGVTIIHAQGASYVLFSNLPENIRQLYAYDPQAAELLIAKKEQAKQEKKVELNSKVSQSSQRISTSENKENIPIPVVASTVEKVNNPSISTETSSLGCYESRSYSGRTYVRSYTRKDGTVVKAHTRRK